MQPHTDDTDTVLDNDTLSAPFNDNMASADEVQRIVERVLLLKQKYFSENLSNGLKYEWSSLVVIVILGTTSW